MKNQNEKRINELLDSMQGAQRAKPPVDLFERIEQQINQPARDIVPINKRYMAMAAAIALLVINVLVMSMYAQSTQTNDSGWTNEVIAGQEFVSTYKLYE